MAPRRRARRRFVEVDVANTKADDNANTKVERRKEVFMDDNDEVLFVVSCSYNKGLLVYSVRNVL
jgi:hypothetical protein